jgi:hypothetical protein
VDGPQHQHLQPDGRRRRGLGRPGAVHHRQHIFANLGDGTYFHSGILAIRQSIAAGVNITYKVLYNDAVAMTGGQQVGERPEGHSVLQIMKSLVSEGVSKLVIVTDEPREVRGRGAGAGVTVHHRDELDAIQRELREIKGTTAIIYDQTCATEKRRRRKRGKLADPDKRVVINELVCEGCGDCSVQSNCLSVEPLETEFGRKRRINQNSCNKDFSCVKGFCPSFVTVEGGQLKKPKKERRATWPRCRRCPSPRCRWPKRPGASWWAAWAAPASSPSASCWAWPRTWKARAWSRRTPAAWRRRAAPPGATSRSPTGPRPSSPPRSTPRRPTS